MQNKIKLLVQQLTEKYGTAEPEALCRQMGIVIADCDLPDVTRGFCMTLSYGTAIVTNQKLCPEARRACIAHELGHAMLHDGLNYMFIQKSTCMVAGRYEREANLFAACLLMSKLEQSNEIGGATVPELSAALFLPAESIEEYFKNGNP